ncbi:biliverdin-producing heme oxygenase [Jatrophihabitans endophyticus]|uniref:biliverdin-producing heme oxygenase n=1 Tax=Jatrophihabitans endophyticus TaxID=1206085 RepID=UPI0009341203|nr:biliverdin-producing heme oxygenase [Jatrophihabitans endophyticus]
MAGPPLTARLRAATRDAHERAETTPFVADLVAGRVPFRGYVALVVQNWAIYRALEGVAERWAADPVAGAFVIPELMRVPSIERDLAHLAPQWREVAERLVLPATTTYVARLETHAATRPEAYVAHHYVRYLGDLSGGQVVGRSVERAYGEDGERSSSFYRFDAIAKIKPFRDEYRRRLDDAPLTAAQRDGVVAEAVTAFELNVDVLRELGAAGRDTATGPLPG